MTDPGGESRPAGRPNGPARAPLHRRPSALLLVAAGGAVGTLGRYGLGEAYPSTPRGWPTGTFVANLVGAFVLGLLLEALTRTGPDDGWRQRLRLLAGTGVCGGFTTYSTLAVETDLLVRDHSPALAFTYLAVSAVAGVVVAVTGVAVAVRCIRPGPAA